MRIRINTKIKSKECVTDQSAAPPVSTDWILQLSDEDDNAKVVFSVSGSGDQVDVDYREKCRKDFQSRRRHDQLARHYHHGHLRHNRMYSTRALADCYFNAGEYIWKKGKSRHDSSQSHDQSNARITQNHDENISRNCITCR